jgi:hypothetical protein
VITRKSAWDKKLGAGGERALGDEQVAWEERGE